jgi:hypothetical protein
VPVAPFCSDMCSVLLSTSYRKIVRRLGEVFSDSNLLNRSFLVLASFLTPDFDLTLDYSFLQIESTDQVDSAEVGRAYQTLSAASNVSGRVHLSCSL